MDDISGNYVYILFSYFHMHHKFLDLKVLFWCYFLKHHSNRIYIQIQFMLDLDHDWTPRLISIYLFCMLIQGPAYS